MQAVGNKVGLFGAALQNHWFGGLVKRFYMHFLIKKPRDVLVIRRLNALIADAPIKVLEFLGSLCDGEELIVVKSALQTFMSEVSLPKPPTQDHQRPLTSVRVPSDGPFKNKKPTRFRLGSWECEMNYGDWRDLVLYVCEILYLEHPENFRECASRVTGKHRDYISDKAENLEKAEKIWNADIFVETNLSADNSVNFVCDLAQKFGYGKPEISAV